MAAAASTASTASTARQQPQPQPQPHHQPPPPLPPHPPFHDHSNINNNNNNDPVFLHQQQQQQQQQQLQQPVPPTLAQRDAHFAQAVRTAASSGIPDWTTLIHLAPLASQYHLSPYSIIKYGPQGSPFPYIPLTLQQPQLVDETMAKQREAERVQQVIRAQQAEERRLAAEAAIAQQQHSAFTAHSQRPNGVVSNTQQQPPADDTLATANAHAHATGNPPVKTSDTHPINISTLIPPHLVPIISHSIFASTQGTQQDHRGRDMEAISQPTQDDATSTANAEESGERQSKRQSSRSPLARNEAEPVGANSENEVEEDGIGLGEKRKRSLSRVDDSLLPSASLPSSATGLPVAASSADSTFSASASMANSSPNRPAAPTSPISFVRLSCTFDLAHAVCDQPELHNVPAPPDAPHPVIAAQAATAEGARSVCEDPEAAVEAAKNAVASAKAGQHESGERGVWAATADLPSSQSTKGAEAGELSNSSTAAAPPASSSSAAAAPTPRRIGNLLLSSCPGKKVRLTGPVRGRGAICRSLPLDLLRMRSLGIRALVCCLDDDELAFLGAPWDEYALVARQAGLEVVRIPIAEGFAPSSVRELDERVGEVIGKWSMEGEDVLVHCRGGVGRAGLFACAWMLKMGLVRENGEERERERERKRTESGGGAGQQKRAQTPQRVKNGTATPAVLTSPFLVGRDLPELGELGIDVPVVLPGSLSLRQQREEEDDGARAGSINGLDASPSLNAISNLDGVSLSSPVKRGRELVEDEEGRGRAGVGAGAAGVGKLQQQQQKQEERRDGLVRRQQEVLRTVERLIRTIRTRRSPKAIETAEQVKFLVDYVAYLENAEEERLRSSDGRTSTTRLANEAMDLS